MTPHLCAEAERLWAFLATCPPIFWMRMNADTVGYISEQAGIPDYLVFEALNDLMSQDVFFEQEFERDHIKKAIPFRNAWFGDGVSDDKYASLTSTSRPPPHKEESLS